jgi:hypothetical protein
MAASAGPPSGQIAQKKRFESCFFPAPGLPPGGPEENLPVGRSIPIEFNAGRTVLPIIGCVVHCREDHHASVD